MWHWFLIGERNAKKGKPPPKFDPNKPIDGEYVEDATITEIKGEIKSGEGVLLDLSGLDPAAAKALRARVEAEGLADHVIFFP